MFQSRKTTILCKPSANQPWPVCRIVPIVEDNPSSTLFMNDIKLSVDREKYSNFGKYENLCYGIAPIGGLLKLLYQVENRLLNCAQWKKVEISWSFQISHFPLRGIKPLDKNLYLDLYMKVTLKPPVIFRITQKQHHWMTHPPKLELVVPAIWWSCLGFTPWQTPRSSSLDWASIEVTLGQGSEVSVGALVGQCWG